MMQDNPQGVLKKRNAVPAGLPEKFWHRSPYLCRLADTLNVLRAIIEERNLPGSYPGIPGKIMECIHIGFAPAESEQDIKLAEFDRRPDEAFCPALLLQQAGIAGRYKGNDCLRRGSKAVIF